MEISNEGSEANIAFWKREFGKFVYAKTEAEAVSVLVNALRSENAMPDILRLVLADMLETGGVRSTIDPSWKIKIVRRGDTMLTNMRLGAYAYCKDVLRQVGVVELGFGEIGHVISALRSGLRLRPVLYHILS